MTSVHSVDRHRDVLVAEAERAPPKPKLTMRGPNGLVYTNIDPEDRKINQLNDLPGYAERDRTIRARTVEDPA